MHFEKTGAGPAVVLVHGLGASSFSWRDTAAKLSARFTTYAVDLLGFGQSAAPAGFAYTAKAQADAVAALMQAQGVSNPIIIGHSMGGAVCLYLSAQAGQGKMPTLSKMVLIAAVTRPRSSALGGGSGGAAAITELPGPIIARQVLEQAYADPSRITPAQVGGYAKGLSSPGQKQALVKHSANLAQISFSATELGAIKTETLIIWGEKDNFLPLRDGADLQHALPKALPLKEVKDCGHIPHEEHAAETNGLIETFLK